MHDETRRHSRPSCWRALGESRIPATLPLLSGSVVDVGAGAVRDVRYLQPETGAAIRIGFSKQPVAALLWWNISYAMDRNLCQRRSLLRRYYQISTDRRRDRTMSSRFVPSPLALQPAGGAADPILQSRNARISGKVVGSSAIMSVGRSMCSRVCSKGQICLLARSQVDIPLRYAKTENWHFDLWSRQEF